MENEIFYLVGFIGTYLKEEGDKSFYLFRSYDDAKKTYESIIDETYDFYENELDQVLIDTDFGDCCTLASNEGDIIDIFILPIEPNGKLFNIIM